MPQAVMKGPVICDIMQTCLCNAEFFHGCKNENFQVIFFFFRFFLVLLKKWIVSTC